LACPAPPNSPFLPQAPGPDPMGRLAARLTAAFLGAAVALDAMALGDLVRREPVGQEANELLLPGLRRVLLTYVAALTAAAALSLFSALCAMRPLLLLVALSSGLLAAGSAGLSYAVHLSTNRIGPDLAEECRKLLSQEPGTWEAVASIDASLRELASGLSHCRVGMPEARTIDECPDLLHEMSFGAEHEASMRLERDLETRLGCAGLCHRLGAPLFAGSAAEAEAEAAEDGVPEAKEFREGAGRSRLPACWRSLALSLQGAGFVLVIWLGCFSAPFFLGASMLLAITLLPSSTREQPGGCSHDGYQLVHPNFDDRSALATLPNEPPCGEV